VPVFTCGRSLYIDWGMVVVVGGNVLHHVKREGELFRREKCPGGICPRGKYPGGNVLHSSLDQPVNRKCKRSLICFAGVVSHEVASLKVTCICLVQNFTEIGQSAADLRPKTIHPSTIINVHIGHLGIVEFGSKTTYYIQVVKFSTPSSTRR